MYLAPNTLNFLWSSPFDNTTPILSSPYSSTLTMMIRTKKITAMIMMMMLMMMTIMTQVLKYSGAENES